MELQQCNQTKNRELFDKMSAIFYFTMLGLIAMVLFGMDSSHATAITGLTKTEQMLSTITTALTGPIGKGVSLVAIIALGFAAWSGRLSGALALKIIIGIVLILGAGEFVTLFTGVDPTKP